MHLFRSAAVMSLLLVFVWPIASADASADDHPQVVLVTSVGDIVLELDAKRAPGSVENFIQYVNDGFYDGTIFHRVIEGFMIQGGGFTKEYTRKPTRPAIKNEANNGLSNEQYSIAMARTNAPHSATSQFFINNADNSNLDHSAPTPRGWGYTVFGRVIDGESVVDAISQVATGAGGPFSRDAPRKQIIIERAFVTGLPDSPEDTTGALTSADNIEKSSSLDAN
jgi:cyclophilin family peptidyl-prolyl cis-trans isomerase